MSTIVTIATELLPDWYEEYYDAYLEEMLEEDYPELRDVYYNELAENHTVHFGDETAAINLTSILQKVYSRYVVGE